MQAAPVVVEIELGELQARPLDQQTAGLADIQRAAPAESDHRIATRFAKDLGGVGHVLLDRIGVNAVEKFPGAAQLLVAQRLAENLEGARLNQTGIGHYQGFSAAYLPEPCRQLRDSTSSKNRGGWKREGGQRFTHRGASVAQAHRKC